MMTIYCILINEWQEKFEPLNRKAQNMLNEIYHQKNS